MPYFSERSNAVLDTVHPTLQQLFRRVVLQHDCTILPDGGKRTEARQAELVAAGKSQTMHSKHLTGHAVDVAPYPIDWEDWKRWYAFGGYVRGIAEGMEIDVRWGGDWNGDWSYIDQSFHDLPHWELRI
jgi:peptidoglycan L-alanyl-D-glutamate endopeptidase CwlK